ADGNEALRVARRYRPAVVLADLRMPNMDGFQLAREMSEDLMLSTIPVVLITASLDAHPNLPTAESLGVVAIVEKSPNPKGLVQTIWTAIRRNSPPPRPVQEKTPALPKVEVAPAAVTEMKELIRLQNAQLSVLAGISSALVDQQDMHEVLKEAVAWCLDLSFVRKGAAWVVLPGRGLQLAATEGWSPAEVMVLEELVQDSSVTANLWQNDPVILRAQAGHHPAAASRLARLDVATLVVVPLQRGPEHLGLIAMASSDEGLRRMGYSLGRAVQGQLCQAILLSRTISELRDAERQLEEVADYSRDSVMITNQAGRIIYANPRACSVLDIPKARLVGRYIHDFIQPWAPESASWDALLSTPDIRPRTVRVSTRHTGLHRQLRTHILWETDPALSLPGVD
ncbi:MAG TPA: response regulator, partial [Myxococcota bacterium]|nr:response regulator [Myxococcota bacterium]